ncbi:MAG: mechanosensitive ion channel family protein [Cytophagales bacterium]|nr:mechanosensitive ion channel family protein [Armatimonadota bacterium]
MALCREIILGHLTRNHARTGMRRFGITGPFLPLSKRLSRRVFYYALLLLVTFSPRSSVKAQIPGLPLLPSLPSPSPVAATPSPPRIARANVVLNGRILFSVAADTPAQAQDRADLVILRLSKALNEATDPTNPPSVTVRTTQPTGSEAVLQIGKESLLTVTRADADARGETPAQLAGEWSEKIGTALQGALLERQPDYLREAALRAGRVILIAALINVAVWILANRFFDRPGWPVVSLVWLLAAYRITDLFPLTRPLHHILGTGVVRPLSIFIVVGLEAAVASRLLAILLQRIFPPLPDTLSPEERTVRTLRRRATLGAVARITGTTLIWIVALFVALSWAGVNLSALLASAGLIGVAISLAAQDTMKDLVAGVNILIDDRFGVGDTIQVGEHQGTVETLNLRITQIRDMSGRLITFPNRSIELVANATLRWAQVDFKVNVSYETDLRAAMATLETTAQMLKEEWPERILEPPLLLGAESFNPSDVTLRMTLRTLPGDQWAVARELRLRVKEAFDKEGILIAVPQRAVMTIEKTGEVGPNPLPLASEPPVGLAATKAT